MIALYEALAKSATVEQALGLPQNGFPQTGEISCPFY